MLYCPCGSHEVNLIMPGAMALCQIRSGALFCRIDMAGEHPRLHSGGVFAGRPIKDVRGDWWAPVRSHQRLQSLHSYGVTPSNGEYSPRACVLPLDLAKEYQQMLYDLDIKFYGGVTSRDAFAC